MSTDSFTAPGTRKGVSYGGNCCNSLAVESMNGRGTVEDDMTRPQIFVSYAHQDSRWFDRNSPISLMPTLIKSLEELDQAEVWYDRRRLGGGDPFQEEIEQAIGYVPGSRGVVRTVDALLALYEPHVDHVYYAHEPTAARRGVKGSVVAIFSVKKA